MQVFLELGRAAGLACRVSRIQAVKGTQLMDAATSDKRPPSA